MRLRTADCDFAALSAQVKAASDEELRTSYPALEAALKSAQRRKLVEPDSVEFAGQLAAEGAPSVAALRDFLQDSFGEAAEKAPQSKAKPADPPPAPPAGNGATFRWLQWIIVWASVLTAAHVWLGLDISNLWPRDGGRWGLDGYLYPAYTYHRSELALVILVVGALLLWQTSARWPARTGTPARSLADVFLSTKALVVACLIILLFLLALHFSSASQRRRTPSFGSFGGGSSGAFGKF